MTLDELRGHVADLPALPLGDSQTIRMLLSRTNAADPKQLLAAALAVAREQTNQKIAELERALDDSKQDRRQFEDQMQELREKIKSLARKCEPKGKRT